MTRIIAVSTVLLALVAPALAQDSLNCRQVALWPEPPDDYIDGYKIALDPLRDLVFLRLWGNETLGNDPYLGVHILDVRDPAHPRRLSSTRHDGGDEYLGLAYHGNRLYFGQEDHWEIWDVSDPEEPAKLARVDDIGAYGLAVDGDYLYVACEQLYVFDVSDPRNPVEVGRCTTPEFAYNVFVAEGLAYVVDVEFGLRIIDISDPTAPREIGACEIFRSWQVAVARGYAYLTDDKWGGADTAYWHIVDISDPENPVLVVSVPERHGTEGIAASEDEALVYIGSGSSSRGMLVFDVSNPAEPVEVGYYRDNNPSRPFQPTDIVLAGRLAFVAAAGDLRVIEFLGTGVEEPPNERPSFAGHGPTVVRGVLMLSGLGTRSELSDNSVMSRAALLNASGRKVMELQPGDNDVRHLSPGVYFIRAEGSRIQGVEGSSAKVVIQR